MIGSHSHWIRRLSGFGHLTQEEQRALGAACTDIRQFTSRDDLFKVGEPNEHLVVVLDGFAGQYRLLPDGRRQFLAYLIAGDMCDPRQLLRAVNDTSTCAMCPSRIALLSRAVVEKLERYPGIRLAVDRYALVQQAITREWLVDIGHRTAFERLSHLLCELFLRLDAVGLTKDHEFELPLTQAELGDTLALSVVHINRTLMELRRLKLVTFQNRVVAIHDYVGLTEAAGFNAAYLGKNLRG